MELLCSDHTGHTSSQSSSGQIIVAPELVLLRINNPGYRISPPADKITVAPELVCPPPCFLVTERMSAVQ